MTRDDLVPYVSTIAGLMKLGHWEIHINPRPPVNEEAWASITPWKGRYGATLYISDELLTAAGSEIRYVVTHELLHCLFAPQADPMLDILGRDAREAFKLATEYVIDHLASLLAPHHPLPGGSLEPATDA